MTVVARCHGDAPAVLARAREVMAVLLDESGPPWPSVEAWRDKLPNWFVQACGRERSAAELARWLDWWRALPAEEQSRATREQRWSLADWLYWLGPSERQWFWWDAAVEDPDNAVVMVEVPGWPAPLGALDWLLRSAGAFEVLHETPATA